jgi:hypothetical protein
LLGLCGIVDVGWVIQASWRGVLGWVTAVEPKRLSGAAGFGWLIGWVIQVSWKGVLGWVTAVEPKRS